MSTENIDPVADTIPPSTEKELSQTKQVIARMMAENTGRHFLDSGDAYGRHWQQNQGVDFEQTKHCGLSFYLAKWTDQVTGTDQRRVDITLSHNIYHWLSEKLTYVEGEEKAMDLLDRYMRMKGASESDRTWFRLMQEFPTFWSVLRAREDWFDDGDDDRPRADYDNRKGIIGINLSREYEPAGIYRDGEPVTVNTYNDADGFLSQTLQFTYFETANAEYCLLQIHGGADVRGGYTRPRLFTVNEELGIFDYRRGSIYCTGKGPLRSGLAEPDCNHHWDSDDGCTFYDESGSMSALKLDKYPAEELNDEVMAEVYGEDHPWKKDTLFIATEDMTLYGTPVKKGTGFCPKCGGTLEGGFY